MVFFSFLFFKMCAIFADGQRSYGRVFLPSGSKLKEHPVHRAVELGLALESRRSNPSG